jgi:transposase-like protein
MSGGLPAFAPPHCPQPGCDSHANPHTWRFKKKGFYARPQRRDRIQRYLCQHCGRSFSSQTFAPDYWLRRPELLAPLFFRIRACSGIRQIAHELGVAPSTVQRQTERLGRHCLLFHERLRPRVPREPMVLDGLRTLESGSYWPFDLHLLVGPSHYVYGFNDAELRRSGTLRPGQRRHRARLEQRFGRPDPQATRKAVEELVARVVPRGASAVLRSDDHPSYPRALARLSGRRLRHETTSSRAARTARNPLFPVNLADLLLRHGSANHKRKTIAFSKRRQGALYRAAIWVVWRNYVKPASERRRSPPPAVTLGIVAQQLSVDEILARRLFPWQQPLGTWLRACYEGRIRTRCLARNRVHQPVYAL